MEPSFFIVCLYFSYKLYISIVINKMDKKSHGSIDQLFKNYQLKNLNLYCRCKLAMEDLCIQSCGEPSLHCQNKQCNYSNRRHKYCRKISLFGLTELLQKRFDLYKILLQKIEQIEEDFIARIRKERKHLYSKVIFREFEDEQVAALEDIFLKKSAGSIKGTHIEDVYKKLILEHKLKEENEKQLKEFNNHFLKLEAQINLIRHNFNWAKAETKLFADSKIISNKRGQYSRFILDCLGNPTGMKLLFRASENQFLAAKFHQICDGIPNLLVLVKTEFGKIIGGFNPFGWRSPPKTQTLTDNERKCFIFSVSLQQKMNLVKLQNAINNSREWGPVFGFDIQLFDRCNQNKTSQSYFPSAYNFSSQPYLRNEETWQAFLGSSFKNFCVAEYEVYSVVR